jgi:exocyst complex component 4
MEHILISSASHLRLPNQFGIKKILRNILALQQSIKSLTNDRQDSEFEKAKFYYSLFFISPKVFLLLRIHSYAEMHFQETLNGAREKHIFNFDEYQTMLNFQCSVDPSDAAAASKAINRDYSSYVVELHGLEMDKSDTLK